MALKGIKVIELAGLAPGPFCGMILKDFGASVIRVDRIGADQVYPDFVGHGKKSIAVNLKTAEGIEIFKRMSKQSDVIIDPFRRGVMEKLKLGPDDITKINKRIIYARLTGFGQKGPYANMAGHDINYVGLSGLLSLFGRANNKPTPPINFAADFAGGGLMCAFGIVLALYERNHSNIGQIIDASMVEGTAYVGSWLFRSQPMVGLWGNPRGQNILDTGTHFYDTYETKDERYMAVGAIEPQFYAILLDKLGLSEDKVPQFGDFETNRALFADIFKTKTQEEWCTIFDGSDACVTPILSVKDAPNHPHNKENKTFTIVKDNYAAPNPAPRLSRTPGTSMAIHTNPERGEHTIEILSKLEYSSKEIDEFVKKGTVKQSRKQAKL